MHRDWFILLLLLPTPTIWFSLDHKRNVSESVKIKTFWFFWLRFRRAYDSAYDSDFWFSLGHKRSYDSNSDSVASVNQPFFRLLRETFLIFPCQPQTSEVLCRLIVIRNYLHTEKARASRTKVLLKKEVENTKKKGKRQNQQKLRLTSWTHV